MFRKGIRRLVTRDNAPFLVGGIPVFLFCIGLAAAMLITACVPEQTAPRPSAKPRVVQPDTHDGKVFYFPVTGDDYRVSLAAWLKLLQKADPDLHCRYFGADYSVIYEGGYQGSHSELVGHTIVCTSTAQNAQDETVP